MKFVACCSYSPRKEEEPIYKVTGTDPNDAAAHFILLGESLQIIGQRLKEHEVSLTKITKFIMQKLSDFNFTERTSERKSFSIIGFLTLRMRPNAMSHPTSTRTERHSTRNLDKDAQQHRLYHAGLVIFKL